MLPHKYTSTDIRQDADYEAKKHSRALATAFQVVGALVANRMLEINIRDEDGRQDFFMMCEIVADVIVEHD